MAAATAVQAAGPPEGVVAASHRCRTPATAPPAACRAGATRWPPCSTTPRTRSAVAVGAGIGAGVAAAGAAAVAETVVEAGVAAAVVVAASTDPHACRDGHPAATCHGERRTEGRCRR